MEQLKQLIADQENAEGVYQSYFTRNPWIFGNEYCQIDSHKVLDDKTIPDFTGIRTTDRTRDIIEIKPPFLPLFNKDGSFHKNFDKAWKQTIKYFDFTERQRQYLRDKGLIFENPRCYLVAGFDLSNEQLEEIRLLERHCPIIFRTYNDLISMGEQLLELIKLSIPEK